VWDKVNLRVILIVCMLFTLVQTYGVTDQKPEMLFFTVEDCESCQNVKREFLPDFLKRFGQHFTFVELDAKNPAYLDSLYTLESRTGIAEEDKDFPAVYFMGSMIEGEIPVRMKLEFLVKQYLANPDSMKEIDKEVMSRIPVIVKPETGDAVKPVSMAYFYEQGCKLCSRTEKHIEWLKNTYPFLSVDAFNIAEKRSKLIASALSERSDMPVDRYMSTPVIFIGRDFLLAENISLVKLDNLIKKYTKTGSEPFWRNMSGEELSHAEEKIKSLFRRFTLWGISLAGLGDGINPCAFATILFFVSYLGMVGRKKNEILVVGLSFASAVFLTYFLIGIGLFKIIETMSYVKILSKIIFGGTAVLCIIFGFLSINDYLKVQSGKTSDMTLQLPAFLKRQIHTTIRTKVRMKSYVTGAFIAGFLVSILELACTGQVYLPTIILMVRSSGTRAVALSYLILYNICFIVPLLVVFGVVYFGVSSQSIARMMESRVGMVKLLLAVVFFTVAGLLTWMVFF